MSATESTSTREKKPLSWLMRTLIYINIAVLGLVGWSWIYFGSIPRALAYASGDRLLADAKTKSFGTAESGVDQTVSFRLTNMSNHPITLIGAKTTCGCLVIEELPLTITPGRDHSFKVLVLTNLKSGDFVQLIDLYTDQLTGASTSLKIVGHLNKPKSVSSTSDPGGPRS